MNVTGAGVRNPRFPLLDSLRAGAALSVFAVHLPFAFRLASDNPVRPYLLQLNVGVAVFFLISGFLLYRPFAQARYAGDDQPPAAPYAQRRALRIIPAYWVALPFVVLLVGHEGGETVTATPVFSARGILSYFGFAQVYSSDTLLGGISAAWSLCAEVAFYAMLPLWAFTMRRFRCRSASQFARSELLGLAVLFAVGVLWTSVAASRTRVSPAVFADPTLIEPWLYMLPSYLDHFAVGMGLAVVSVILADRPAPRLLRLMDRASWLPWLGAAAAYFALAHVNSWFSNSYAMQLVASHELQIVFAFVLLLPAIFGDPSRGLVRRVLANRVLLWIGLVSYALYLWHAAIIVALVRLGALTAFSPAGFTAAALGASLLVAAASFYAVERPALRLGRRLSRHRQPQDADVRMRDLARHERPKPREP